MTDTLEKSALLPIRLDRIAFLKDTLGLYAELGRRRTLKEAERYER